MNTFLKGDDSFPSRDWSMLSTALGALESIIHPQNTPIFDLLSQNDEVDYLDLLEETGLNARQFKRRMQRLINFKLVHEFKGVSQVTYSLEEAYYERVCQKSLNLAQNILTTY